MTQLPSDQHITYQLQYRKCGKSSCSTCRSGHGHGPYWYAYWREGSRLRSGYIGKIHPAQTNQSSPYRLEVTEMPAITRTVSPTPDSSQVESSPVPALL